MGIGEKIEEEFNLSKSKKLEKICEEIFEHPPDWKKIKANFYDSDAFKRDKPLTETEYARYFSEIHLDLCLEKIYRKHRKWDINLNPIEEGMKSDGYEFNYTEDGRVRAQLIEGTDNFEYDKIITIDELPVVFEIKLTDWNVGSNHSKGKRTKRRSRGKGIENSLREDVYKRRLSPIYQRFGKVGYVMVIPNDIYKDWVVKRPKDSEYLPPFQENNGLIVPFYSERKKFREEVIQKVKEYGLKLKKNGSSL